MMVAVPAPTAYSLDLSSLTVTTDVELELITNSKSSEETALPLLSFISKNHIKNYKFDSLFEIFQQKQI